MAVRFIHTADIHLGKTYRHSSGEAARYNDFFRTLAAIVADALAEQVDFVLIAGDLFHTGQILPQTFARTIETLQPLKDANIPCIAVEGNHDWIHRRDSISWMEALSQMGYLRLLRPSRTEEGGYHFVPFDEEQGVGGHLLVGDLNIYGLGYVGAQAGNHVERICEAVTTDHNLLLFHVGIWSFSPVEIGNMKPEESLPLAERFEYLALGHGHKPYIVETPEGRPYGFNPGSPERVNFGEQKYEKGYYLVNMEKERFDHEFRSTDPRPMQAVVVDLDGASDAEQALGIFRDHLTAVLGSLSERAGEHRRPLIDLKLKGKVAFHPFELSREQLRTVLDEVCQPLHVEIRNQLSLVSRGSAEESSGKSLADIEQEVLRELIEASSDYKERPDELVELSLAIRDLVLRGEVEDDELLALLERSEKIEGKS
ncbi:nuclease SbcCD subunit D [Syntrophotalea acetylenivorans]|uniref:Nuclease SbcCD subunit D n=1 Tax=Syntrophotalea acetylenivorans TaxID=1842532 RepID=A0A1L3GQV4_9BACT|nr:exonuclease SbcCD subunit D [Syntrophotalea acetylenivorans]APG28329.1 nuclease SbcCD subunit D [Syntrophotalea acetylenivorans]